VGGRETHEERGRGMNGDRERLEVERLRERVAHSLTVVRRCLGLYGAFNDRATEVAAAKLEQAGGEAKSTLRATRDLSMMLRRSEIGGGLGKALSVPLHTTVPPDVRYVEGDEAAVPPHVVGNQLLLILREAGRNAVTLSGRKRVTAGLGSSRRGWPSRTTGWASGSGTARSAAWA
jgi:signal transduction histidine kinase